jgi:maleylacetate reductase
LRETDLDIAAELAVQNPYTNPVPLSRVGIRALLQRAFFGVRPDTV